MNLFLSLVATIGGLIGVWAAGDYVILSAKKLAIRYRLTTVFVGFVLLALAANIPEIAVAVMAALHGAGQISAGDIIGANFNDVALVIGFTLSLAQPITLSRNEIHEIIRILSISSCLMLLVLWIGNLLPIHGYCLLLCYGIFVIYSWYEQKRIIMPQSAEENTTAHTRWATCKLWLNFFSSIAIILGSSALAIQGALKVTQACGISLEVVGATILALGTTLPEIAIGINALRRKEYALALGPTIGTIFAQITLALGTLTILSPCAINLRVLCDTACFMFLAFIILSSALIKNNIGKQTGFTLLSLFICYLSYHIATHCGMLPVLLL